jgi:hypothetical protein
VRNEKLRTSFRTCDKRDPPSVGTRREDTVLYILYCSAIPSARTSRCPFAPAIFPEASFPPPISSLQARSATWPPAVGAAQDDAPLSSGMRLLLYGVAKVTDSSALRSIPVLRCILHSSLQELGAVVALLHRKKSLRSLRCVTNALLSSPLQPGPS